ncbi:type I 3-dehydroquinate dehydratase [Candidatus Peregrinibacteria bacterium]|nr:type I 3-dehydroquinate dehydratase [Candidatus Peregrinibacteria bacterium]
MICIPIKSSDKVKVLKNIQKAEKLGDIIEIWFDEISDLESHFLKKVFPQGKKPIIYKFTGNLENLEKILIFKPDFIDMDISSDKKIIKKIRNVSPKTEIIISFHDFKKTPEIAQLKRIAIKMATKNADIIKIATYARNGEDSLRMMSFLSFLKDRYKKVICLCMGKRGEITRKTGHLLGNYLMYAPTGIDYNTAPGQISAAELKKIQALCH